MRSREEDNCGLQSSGIKQGVFCSVDVVTVCATVVEMKKVVVDYRFFPHHVRFYDKRYQRFTPMKPPKFKIMCVWVCASPVFLIIRIRSWILS